MYRHYVLLRYYTYSVGAFITAGLITLYFTKGALTPAAGWIIKTCGAILLLVVFAFEFRISKATEFFYGCMEAYATQLDDGGPFRKVRPSFLAIWFSSILVAVMCLLGMVAWIFFAELPR
jgi:hypothetical protein